MNRYQPSRHNYSKSSGLSTILLLYVLPFIVVNGLIFYLVTSKPKVEVTIADNTNYQTTTATITIKSLLPTKGLTAAMDNEPLELSKEEKKSYTTAAINNNGVLEVYIENFNGMSVTVFEHINVLDDNPPAVTSSSVEDGVLTIQLEDSQSGLDYTSIYGVTSKAITISPLSVDKTTATVTFDMDSDGITIHASDLSANELQASFKSHLEGSDEVLTDEGTNTQEEFEENTGL